MTNNWSWSGGTEVGVESLEYSNWVCPGTATGGLPDPGYWDTPIDYSPIPACSCDSALTDTVWEACPSDLSGGGITYEREWDCALNNWEAEENWEIINDDCSSCSWQKPSGSSTLEDFAYGEEQGTGCDCSLDPAPFCHDYASGGKYSVWTGCECTVPD